MRELVLWAFAAALFVMVVFVGIPVGFVQYISYRRRRQ